MKKNMIASAILAGVIAIGATGGAAAAGPPAAVETNNTSVGKSTSVGLTNGWTLIRPWSCGGTNEGHFVIYLDYTGKKKLQTTDPNWIMPISVLCANGRAFYANTKNGVWLDVSYSSQNR